MLFKGPLYFRFSFLDANPGNLFSPHFHIKDRVQLYPFFTFSNTWGRGPLFVFFSHFFLLLAVLGLCCCARAFSSCSERGLLFVAVRRLLIAVASLVAEHGL